MKIGILKEEKKPADKRVALTPDQCKFILEKYPSVEIFAMQSNIRCYSDNLYRNKGVNVVNDLSHCDILLGIKEVPTSSLIAGKIYLFFSHTIKGQKYNRKLLSKMVDLKIQMVDYEVLKDTENKRLIGFGKYAGIVGAYNTFLTYGLKVKKYNLKPAYNCIDKNEMESQLCKIILQKEKIVVTGKGRVGQGINEILNKIKIRKVSKNEFLNNNFNEPIYTHLDYLDYNIRKDEKKSNKSDFYNNPSLYKSSFMKFAKKADIFIAGHYYAEGSPYLFSKKDAKNINFNIKVVGDISCDIDGPVGSTIRSSSIKNPIYGYNPITEKEDDFQKKGVIAVMAVDNLPCELPKNASEDFGNELIKKILPKLLKNTNDILIKNATICKNGLLTKKFNYLEKFIK